MKIIRTSRGFTLMELMIAVVIVGILAAIAYPSYTDHMMKTRRSDGQSALMNLSSFLESYYTDNNTYTGATLAGLGLTATSPSGYYTISISAIAATSYTLRATPTGAQATDTCGALTLTNTNVKGPSTSCWQ